MGNQNSIITAPVGLQPDMYGVQGLIKAGTFYDVCGAVEAHVSGETVRIEIK